MSRSNQIDLRSLFVEHRAGLLMYLARRTADPEIALDLLGETFAQAVASRDRFRRGPTDQPAR